MAKAGGKTKPSDELDLTLVILTLWKGKLIIAGFVFLALLGGALQVASTRPTYQADALLQLEERSNQLGLPSAMQALVDRTTRSATEIEVLRSRLVLGQAVADLHLDWRVAPRLAPVFGQIIARYRLPLPEIGPLGAYARPGERLTLAHLSVPPRWINRPIDLTVTPEGYVLDLPDGRRIEGVAGDLLSLEDAGFAIAIEAIEAPARRVFAITQIDEQSAIAAVRAQIGVSERGRGSGILEVRYSGTDRAENVRILDAVTRAYVQQNISRSAAEAQSSLEFIADQLPEAEAALRRAEAALNAYRQQQVAIDVTFETQNILTQITAVELELAELTRAEDEVRDRYTPSHPVYSQLLENRERLETRLAGLRAEAGNLPETQREILNLTRGVEVAQGIYTELLTRQQEVEVLRASTVGNVRVIDAASSARAPIAPRAVRMMGVALLIGLITGIGVVLLRNWLRKGVQDGRDIEALGLPVFATINYTAKGDTDGARKEAHKVLALTDPTDLSVEAFRSLRTSLHFGMLDASSRSLAITSTHPGAGKSFCAVNLAVTAAQAGQKICLIDADMRRGYLRQYFGVKRNQPGLAEVLAGDQDIERCVVPGPVENLYFLPTGKYPPNPSELLMRKEFEALITVMDEFFDLTILDCPPILAVTDPVVISKVVGTSILVARHDQTPLGEIEAALKAFEVAGSRFSGAVLNGFDPKKAKVSGYGYGYGYGYAYAYKTRKD